MAGVGGRKLLKYYERNENICPHKNGYPSIHSCIVYSSQSVGQPRRPSKEEQMNKKRCIRAMDHHSAIKGTEY